MNAGTMGEHEQGERGYRGCGSSQSLPRRVSLNSVKKGIIALLGIVLALHVGIGCGVAKQLP
jgi:hypothetical protein